MYLGNSVCASLPSAGAFRVIPELDRGCFCRRRASGHLLSLSLYFISSFLSEVLIPCHGSDDSHFHNPEGDGTEACGDLQG